MDLTAPICARHTYVQRLTGPPDQVFPEGERFVAGFTEPAYEAFMQEWEAELNHYLETGSKRPPT